MRPVFQVFLAIFMLLIGVVIGNHSGMRKPALLLDFVPQIPRNETFLGMQACRVYEVCDYEVKDPCITWAGRCLDEYYCWLEYHNCDNEYAARCFGQYCWFSTIKDLTHAKSSINDTRPEPKTPMGYNSYNPYGSDFQGIIDPRTMDPAILDYIYHTTHTTTVTTIKPGPYAN